MKTIYLLVAVLIVASCSPSSHVPCMPSEPLFESKVLQAKTSIGLSFDHIEAQGAVSVLPFFGLTGDYYKGSRGIKQYEFGGNLFAPINKEMSWYISFAGGKGEGVYKGSYATSIIGSPGYSIDTKFNSVYIQPGIYHVYKKGKDVYKFSLGFKHEEVFFSRFNVDYYSQAGLGYYTYTVFSSATHKYAVIETPFVGFITEPDEGFGYCQVQLGYRKVSNTFKTFVTGNMGGDGAYIGVKQLESLNHPLFSPFMLNLTVGLKLDYLQLLMDANTNEL